MGLLLTYRVAADRSVLPGGMDDVRADIARRYVATSTARPRRTDGALSERHEEEIREGGDGERRG